MDFPSLAVAGNAGAGRGKSLANERTQPFIAAEKEELVLNDRTANDAAELLQLHMPVYRKKVSGSRLQSGAML